MMNLQLFGNDIKIKKYYNLTELEANEIKSLANFTEDELDYFNMKLKDYSNVKISMEMNVSTSKVSKLARDVKTKVLRIIT